MSISGIGGLSNFDSWRLDNWIRLMPDKVTDASDSLYDAIERSIGNDDDIEVVDVMTGYDERYESRIVAEVELTFCVDDADPHELGLMLVELGQKLIKK